MRNPMTAWLRRRKMVEIQKDFYNSPQGRDLLSYYARNAFIFDTTFVASDPQQTALNEGARRFVLSIMRDLSIDLDQLRLMAERNQNDNTDTV